MWNDRLSLISDFPVGLSDVANKTPVIVDFAAAVWKLSPLSERDNQVFPLKCLQSGRGSGLAQRKPGNSSGSGSSEPLIQEVSNSTPITNHYLPPQTDLQSQMPSPPSPHSFGCEWQGDISLTIAVGHVSSPSLAPLQPDGKTIPFLADREVWGDTLLRVPPQSAH